MGCVGSSQSNWQQNQNLSPEQEAQLRKAKQEVYGNFKSIALLLLASSVISIACGVVLISLGYTAGFPITSCAPIWSGGIMLGAAVVGLIGISTDPNEKRENNMSKQDYYMNASRGMLWWMCVWIGMCVGYEIYSLVVCAMKDEGKCPKYPDVMLAMQIISLVMKAIFITCSVMTCKIYRGFDQIQKQICPFTTVNATLQNQGGLQSHTQYGMQPPPTYDQSMSTSKY